MDEQGELLERGRKCIKRLEILQYEFFNGRMEWTNIEFNDLKLFIAHSYYGSPKIEDDEFNIGNSSDKIFMHYKKKDKTCVLNIIKKIQNNFMEPYVNKIDVGFTLVHSICKNKCNVCHNFPDQDIHQWLLLRIKLNSKKVIYIDLYHNRTYRDWNDYIKNNTLPNGYMFYPESGFYDEAKYLSQNITPSSSLKNKILSCIDVFGTSAMFSSCIVLSVGTVFPIMAPILIGSAATVVSASVWDIGRQICRLSDMGSHNQSLLSSQASRYWLNLSLSVLGVITAPVNATVRTMEMANSAILSTKYGKSLLIFQKGACLSQCSLELIRIFTNFKYNDKITFSDFLSFRLDLFVVTGTLFPMRYIQVLFKCLATSISFSPLYEGIKDIPYCLGRYIFKSVYFVKKHLVKFCEQVLKFLYGTLTSHKCMLAYKQLCKIMNNYKNQLAILNDNELLNHIVKNMDIASILDVKSDELEAILNILCGELMIKLMDKLNVKKDQYFIIFCIEYILEKSKNISFIYKESLTECQCLNINDIDKFNEEFCKVYKLKECCMTEYVLYVIKETIYDTQNVLNAYNEYKLKPENIFNKKKIASLHTCSAEQFKMYEFPAPSYALDSETCLKYAQNIDSVNHEYNQYKFVQPEINEYVLISAFGFSIKIIFFRVSKLNDELNLNISFYQNVHDSINRRLQY